MTLNLERAAMRGKLAELRETKQRLQLRIEGNARHLCQGLNTFLTPPDELEIPLLDEQWDELKSAWAELQVVNNSLGKLEKELNCG